MKLIILIIIAIIMDATLHPALAESDIKACIKFQRQDYSWSHAYAVRGFTISGYDLNRFAREKGYKAHYSSYSTYFIVPWDNGGYISLDIGSSYVPSYEKIVTDQNNINWKIKEGWNYCD
ncbi:MAG: hypothetical protein II847_00115 [Ruminobacter sp.]|jgi:hypothetical protein|uniref:Uncharacterized protein n=1 Tax=Ruminobacter amylophilus TaxID=867 RepID=A0A662ZHZ0_9GAMM|nr:MULTISPECIES: hypothetical protein [Ruminobacter]MBQ3774520.1 hypothetical protein [Ruminobacter sp.]SFP47765.1 hypothetical protein SAMN02910344_01492 [Ruminobacter amylophilus]